MLFGQATNNQSSQNSGSLFGFNPGNTNQNPTQNNNNQQTQQPLFGAQQTGNIGTGLFGGQQNQNNNQAGGSLFGTGQSSNQAGTTSLFGTSQNQNSNQSFYLLFLSEFFQYLLFSSIEKHPFQVLRLYFA